MVWLPSYLTTTFDADPTNLSFTAFPYVMNCLSGVGKSIFECKCLKMSLSKDFICFVCFKQTNNLIEIYLSVNTQMIRVLLAN